ncbi:MAG: thioredoxin fold domain-containing protein [Epsilonproteobacteria bacterium]|nr:thioredoxin fold domain-containing protein [Campylobacterota bacterium]
MKKFTIVLSALMITSSLFASKQSELKKDISRVFANGKIDTSSISIIAQGTTADLKNLHIAIGTIKGSSKPFLLLYNKDTMIVGNIKNRKDGKSIFDAFIAKNRAKIKKALSKIQTKQTTQEVQNNKKIISLFNKDFKNSMFKIKGGNPKGKIIYFITDPNCPYCQQYEKNELAGTIKRSKETRVIPLFLNIPGHETSPMRSSWLLEKAKTTKNSDLYALILKASDKNDNTYKEVDKKFAKEKIAKMKKFLDMGLIQGTPTIFDENGTLTR